MNSEGTKVATASETGTIVRVSYEPAGHAVLVDGASLGAFTGPIFFRPTDGSNQFRVESIRRGATLASSYLPLYRGAIEIARGSATQAGRVNLVNVVVGFGLASFAGLHGG